MVWFIILFILWKKNNPEHARKNFKVLQVVRREGEFFTLPTVFALEGSIEKNCFKMEWYSFCSYLGPNQERIMDQMVSRLSVSAQVSFIKTGAYKGIGQRLIIIIFSCFGSMVFHWWRFCFFAVNYILNFYRPRLIKLAEI